MRHELATANILAERYEVHSALGGRPVQVNTAIYNRTGNHCRLFLPSRGKMPEYARSDDDDDSSGILEKVHCVALAKLLFFL